MRILVRPPELPADLPRAAPGPEPASGTGARLWLVRHADVHDDWQQRAYGNLDVPLSDDGVRQTRDLCEAFARVPLAHVASSHLSRALLLGRGLAAATGAPLRVDPRLREVWRGDWQGLPTVEFRERWERDRDAFVADPWRWKGHGGESDAEVFARAWPVLAEAVAAAKGGEAALATHYNVIRVLVTRALGLAPHESFAFRNDPAHATLLVDAPGGWVLASANSAGPGAVA